MGRIAQLFRSSEPAAPGSASWMLNFLGGMPTASGARVSEERALSLPAVLSAVDRIASAVAALPLHLYKRVENGKKLATDRQLYSLLHDAPNSLMTAIQFRKTMTVHLLLWGNAFAWIERDPQTYQIAALWPLDPAVTTILVSYVPGANGVEQRLTYETTFRNQVKRLMDYEVLHLTGISLDGIIGLSPIRLEREAIGLGLSMQQMMGFYVSNNAVPPVVLKTPGKIGDEAAKNIRNAWSRRHGGENTGSVGLLQEGMDIVKLDTPLKDIEFLGQRGYTVKDVARMYNMPLAMLGEDQTTTYSSAEQFTQWLVTYTLTPWLVTWEQAIWLKLLTPTEEKKYFAKHALDGLLRGDSTARAAFFKAMMETGAYTINTILELEDMNTIGPDGDKHIVPLNMTTIEALGQQPPAPAAPPQRSLEPVYRDAFGRILRRARADIMREAEKRIKAGDSAGLVSWLDGFLADHKDFAERNLRPVCEADGRTGAAESLAKNHAKRLKNDLKTLIFDQKTAGNDLISGISERFSCWADNPEEVFPDAYD